MAFRASVWGRIRQLIATIQSKGGLTPEQKDKLYVWAKALRSGDYQQTTSVLRRVDGRRMCCLGVLCDIQDPNGWSDVNNFDEVKHHGRTEHPALFIMAPYGLDDALAIHFANFNDEDGLTFEEIAEVIDVLVAEC